MINVKVINKFKQIFSGDLMLVVDAENFKKEVLESNIPVVVDFFADWCPPCKLYAPIFEKTSTKFSGKVKFVKLNVDNAIDIAKEYGVMSIPTTILFKEGKVLGNFTGAIEDDELENWIKEKI